VKDFCGIVLKACGLEQIVDAKRIPVCA